MYKKYITRNGKRFGPYYCESYRDKDGKVKTRFVSGPKKKDVVVKHVKRGVGNLNNKGLILGLGVFFVVFILLLAGNINYTLKTTGKVIEVVTTSEDLSVAEDIADGLVESTVDIRDEVDVVEDINSRLIEFEVPEGTISMEFDLLDYGDWIESDVENEESVENFDIQVEESAEKYKWGYNVRLTDLDFMARIDVLADVGIGIVDNQTLKIGDNYLSFADLSEQGYVVRIEDPVVLDILNITNGINITSEVNLTVIEELNVTEINISEVNVTEANISEINISIIDEVNISEVTPLDVPSVEGNITEEDNITFPDEEFVENIASSDVPPQSEEGKEVIDIELESIDEELGGEMPSIGGIEEIDGVEGSEVPSVVSSEEGKESEEETIDEVLVVEEVGIVGAVVRGITGFIVNGFNGITGLAIVDENKISVYIQKDFSLRDDSDESNETSVSVGDIINLDPVLIRVSGAGTAVDGPIVYRCGTLTGAGSYVLNQSLNTTGHCLVIAEDNIEVDLAGFSITGDRGAGITNGDYGINIDGNLNNYDDGQNNITIKNGYITNFTALIYDRGDNGTFYNLTLSLAGFNSEDEYRTFYGIFYSGSYGNISNNHISNSIPINIPFNSYYGIYLGVRYQSVENIVQGNIIKDIGSGLDESGYGIYVDGSDNNNFIDNNISNTFFENVYLTASTGNTFLNTTYSTLYIDSLSNLTSKEHYRVYVNDTIGNNVSGANITAYEKVSRFGRGVYQFNLTTDVTGWTSGGSIVDYINVGGMKTYFSPYVIYVANESYVTEKYYYNATLNESNLGAISTLSSTVVECPSILDVAGKSYIMGEDMFNVSLIEDCIQITNENITLDCAGHYLSSKTFTSSSDYTGIYSAQRNTTIKNCNVSMGTGTRGMGIEFRGPGASNSQIYNSILYGQGWGIYFVLVQNTTIANTTIHSNSRVGLTLYSSSHNKIIDTNISNNTNLDLGVVRTYSINNTFLNVSYLTEEITGSLIRKWYYKAHTVDMGATDVGNASVDIYNGIDESAYIQLTTNDSGWTNRTEIIEYVDNGGTKIIYDTSVIAANFNLTLWDDHGYNVTSQRNNLNDTFILDIDITPPVLSGTEISMSSSSAENAVVATIVWSSDDPSNSSVEYGLSSSLGAQEGNNVMRVNNHSVTLTGLNNNTVYYFNYTSCDFAKNCVTNGTFSFETISPARVGSVSTGGGAICIPNKKCGLCGEDGMRSCWDDNNCGGSYPDEICFGVEVEGGGEDFSEDRGLELASKSRCITNYTCGEWSTCYAVYNLEEIIDQRVLLKGSQKRICVDVNNCGYDLSEKQECSTQLPIIAQRVEECFEDYIKIYDNNDVLIARMKLFDEIFDKLDIQMIFDGNEYCPYCFDNIKNFDEDDVDCVGDGTSCGVCVGLSSKKNYRWVYWMIFGIWTMFLMLVGKKYLDLRGDEKKYGNIIKFKSVHHARDVKFKKPRISFDLFKKPRFKFNLFKKVYVKKVSKISEEDKKIILNEAKEDSLKKKLKKKEAKNEILDYKESIVNLEALKERTKLVSQGDAKGERLIKQFDKDILKLKKKIRRK